MDNQQTDLMTAAENGQIEVVKQLLSAGSKVNEANYESVTALMLASENGHLEIVELLIQSDADINLKNLYGGWTALMYAVGENRLKVAEFLISAGADIEEPGGGIGGYITTPLERAALCGYFEMLKLLIKAGTKVSGDNIRTLEMAVIGGHLEIVKYLVTNGSDVNEKSDRSHPLGSAASYGHLEIFNFLLAIGGDVNIKSRLTLQTPLMWAARGLQSEIVKILIDAGASIDEEDSEGWTALMRAKMSAKYNQESGVLNQFPTATPDLTNYLYEFDFYWSKKLLLPICAKCLVPFQMLVSEKLELTIFRCPMEGKDYFIKFYDIAQLTLAEAQELVADIIELDSEK